jgi:hypothetical protein
MSTGWHTAVTPLVRERSTVQSCPAAPCGKAAPPAALVSSRGIRRVEAFALPCRIAECLHGRMPILHRCHEPHADVAAHHPHNLDRQPMTSRQLHRCAFSDYDGEVAVDAKSAARIVDDHCRSGKAVTLQTRDNVNRPPCL